MKTKKPMSARERKERAAIRKELRAEGLLPPVKKPVNRKKFCEEAEAILRESDYGFTLLVLWALLEMLHHAEYPSGNRSRDAIGAAKAIKMAKARADFEERNRAAGRHEYTAGELYDVVKDIYEA